MQNLYKGREHTPAPSTSIALSSRLRLLVAPATPPATPPAAPPSASPAAAASSSAGRQVVECSNGQVQVSGAVLQGPAPAFHGPGASQPPRCHAPAATSRPPSCLAKHHPPATPTCPPPYHIPFASASASGSPCTSSTIVAPERPESSPPPSSMSSMEIPRGPGPARGEGIMACCVVCIGSCIGA